VTLNPTPLAAPSLMTPLSRRLGIQAPIAGFSHSIDVTVAVTLSGGLGVFGATRNTPDEIAEALAEIRRRVGDRPFGVDLVLPRGMPELDDRQTIEREIPEEHRAFVREMAQRHQVPTPSGPGMRSRFVRSEEVADQQIEAVLSSGVDLFACGIGAPPKAVAAAKARGMTTCALVGSPRHAVEALRTGVDLIVAQGSEAGAHTGQIGTFTLVPQIVDLCGDVPVMAAGGVATGQHIVAALALGAQGVWMGTAWLTTQEYNASPTILRKLLAAKSEDAVICRGDSGKPLRQIRSAWSDAWNDHGAPQALKMPYQDILVGDLLGAIDEFDVQALQHCPAGQGIAYFNETSTVRQIMAAMLQDAEAVREALAVSRPDV
jgi:NAD(P)H-dependent flavin oxidoreductase YrpB (nitropropane dioxygenase family)